MVLEMSGAILIPADWKLCQWQIECIRAIRKDISTVLIAKYDSLGSRRKNFQMIAKKPLYVALNRISIYRGKERIPLDLLRGLEVYEIEFNHDLDGWYTLKDDSLKLLKDLELGFVYKCAVGLWRIDERICNLKILSHHHGNPSKYRGRPAGYYEMLNGESVVGQIVQAINNTLDGGEVLAYGETKVYPYSYRQTLEEAFIASKWVLATAVRRLNRKEELASKDNLGKLYRLPTNRSVARFFCQLAKEKLKRMVYGLFVYKQWYVAYKDQVAMPSFSNDSVASFLCNGEIMKSSSSYSFFADPFVLSSESIIVEAMRRESGKADLVTVDIKSQSISVLADSRIFGHLSFPSTLDLDGNILICPETSAATHSFFLRVDGVDKSIDELRLDSTFPKGLIDPVILRQGGRTYLFASLPSERHVLRLWLFKGGLESILEEHPASPIRMSPIGGRMGGRIVYSDSTYYRIGQNFSHSYGDGISIFEITQITPYEYEECLVQSVSFGENISGPHTLDYKDQILCWDYYTENISPFAFWNRVKTRYKVLHR